jgi:ribosomal protein S18 acetylase RimI-like enzyme
MQYWGIGGMDDTVSFREMKAGDENAVSKMVIRTFSKFVAPGYSSEGIEEFLGGATPESILHRVQQGRIFLVAVIKDEIVGVIAIRDHNHISWLFVDAKYHRRGIAKGLLKRALEICRNHDPGIAEITVNSSPYAVFIYKRLGFQQLQPEQVRNGMRFVPMLLKLGKTDTLKGNEE